MKPPNFRVVDFDERDLDLIESIENCVKCKYSFESGIVSFDSENGFICELYHYKLYSGDRDNVNQFFICDSYDEIVYGEDIQEFQIKKSPKDEAKEDDLNKFWSFFGSCFHCWCFISGMIGYFASLIASITENESYNLFFIIFLMPYTIYFLIKIIKSIKNGLIRLFNKFTN